MRNEHYNSLRSSKRLILHGIQPLSGNAQKARHENTGVCVTMVEKARQFLQTRILHSLTPRL